MDFEEYREKGLIVLAACFTFNSCFHIYYLIIRQRNDRLHRRISDEYKAEKSFS